MSRPKGTLNKTTLKRHALVKEQAVAVRASIDGTRLTRKELSKMSIMEVLVHSFFREAAIIEDDPTADKTDMRELAKIIVPYRYAKLMQVQADLTIHKSPEQMTDEELVAIATTGRIIDVEPEEGESGPDGMVQDGTGTSETDASAASYSTE